MSAVIAINNSIAIPNHETAETAWQEIAAADTFVKKAMSEVNAAEKFIVIGVRLNELKQTLKRANQFDNSAPGWLQAFADDRFEMTASVGTRIAVIGEVLENAISTVEIARLPTNWTVLYALSSGFKKHPEKLKLAIRNGKVTPLMSVKEANALVGKKPKKGKSATSPKATPMENFEVKRKEYIKAAKILTPKECEEEIADVARAFKIKPVKKTKKADGALNELKPQIVAWLGKMSAGKRWDAMHDLAKYLEKQFPDLDIRVATSISSVKINGGSK